MRRSAGIALLIWVSVVPVGAEDTGSVAEPGIEGVVWTDTLRGREIGRETVSARLEDGRWIVTSEARLPSVGVTRFDQTLVAEAGTFECVEYELEAETAGGPQKVAARRTEDGSVRFDAVAPGRTLSETAGGEGPILCLDNLVLAHYTVLGQAAISHVGDGSFSFTAAVPSVLQALPATFDIGDEVPVRIAGEERTARKGRLTVAGVRTNVWYDAASGAPYRVSVPSQEFDARVEGWEEVEDAAAPSGVPLPTGAREEEISFPSPLGAVPGVLTVPPGEPGARFPVVVLLSGSGPNDRDETIGPNKPFRDLARGLAAEGIATLRYDKRSAIVRQDLVDAKERGASDEEMDAMIEAAKGMMLEQEYLVDARAALAFVRSRPESRTDAVFVLGHSLGGLVAPEVAAQDDAVRGVILMAAPGRPFDALIESQIAFQSRVAGLSAEEAAASAREQTAALRAILGREGAGDEAPEEFMSASAAYWKDVARRDLPATLARFDRPVLLLQGDKDIQITVPDDYAALEKALASRDSTPFEAVVFDGLNHLFLPVEGESTGAEYYEPGRMDARVAETIAEWLRGVLGGAGEDAPR